MISFAETADQIEPKRVISFHRNEPISLDRNPHLGGFVGLPNSHC